VTERLRAVFDTNVFVSALLSRNPTSPTQELMERWHNDEFTGYGLPQTPHRS
jgi:predicted nucleic acid-binding protein